MSLLSLLLFLYFLFFRKFGDFFSLSLSSPIFIINLLEFIYLRMTRFFTFSHFYLGILLSSFEQLLSFLSFNLYTIRKIKKKSWVELSGKLFIATHFLKNKKKNLFQKNESKVVFRTGTTKKNKKFGSKTKRECSA